MRKLMWLFAVMALMATFVACEKNERVNEVQINDIKTVKQSEGMIVLGEKINDPFKITNIKKAESSLRSAGVEAPEEIKPNKVYLRFLPANEDEWDILKLDSNLILYDFPLDYELEVNGSYYHDPSLPDTAITWQYTVVPIGYVLPDVKYEVLYEVYIPSFGTADDASLRSNQSSFDEELIIESFKLTGNNEQLISNEAETRGLFNPKRWFPAGTIKVWDDILKQYIALEGAEVHARWSTHIEKDLTDSNGYFKVGGFIFNVNYAIKWQRADYDIRDGNFGQAWFNGPKQKGDWNLNITPGAKSIMYATITRAANKHFYGDNLGIRRPTINGKTKICYMDSKGTGVFWGDWSAGGILPDIKIWGKDINDGNYKTTDIVFATTAHELGHQSHSMHIGNLNFYKVAKSIYESWAETVEWAFTNDEYNKLGIRYFNKAATDYDYEKKYRLQWRWPIAGSKEYSPLFIDLIDSFNQSVEYSNNSLPNDNIIGYSLSYIFYNILPDCIGLNSFEGSLKRNKLLSTSDSDIDEFLKIYKDNSL